MLDTKTTGLNPEKNAMIQLSGFLTDSMKTREIVSEFNIRLRPWDEAEVEEKALEVNGITIEDLTKYPDAEIGFKEFRNVLISAQISQFADKMDKLFILGYNCPFDIGFLKEFWNRYKLGSQGLYRFYNYYAIDLYPIMVDKYVRGELEGVKSLKLVDVCAHYGIEFDAHDALEDAKAVYELWLKINN